MSDVIRLKKGLDISLAGAAEKTVAVLPVADSYALTPDDFRGFTPKLLVKQGDRVAAGEALLFDKYRPELLITSPVSGTVAAINRGDKRKILEVVVTPDSVMEYKEFKIPQIRSITKEQVIALMLEAGLWGFLISRPYGVIANPEKTPKAIFISGFDSSPLAPDTNLILRKEADNVNTAIEILSKLTPGKIHIGLNTEDEPGVLVKSKGAEIHFFNGPHPAGNVGVQIHHISPINKGETVWTIDPQNLAILGRFFRTGKVDMTKIIALTGSEVVDPQHCQIISGANINSITSGKIKPQADFGKVRIISGNVLTGRKKEPDEHIGFYANQITVILEGDKHEFLGWIAPRLSKFSVSRSYFSWLMPKKQYRLDTNLNGGVRALVMSGLYDRYLPMDIYPIYLLKAAMAGDIDKMENLGIYEVIEEDFALCEFVDPSKTEMQEVIRQGIDLMIKELG